MTGSLLIRKQDELKLKSAQRDCLDALFIVQLVGCYCGVSDKVTSYIKVYSGP